jgi:hypothetical protein
LNWIFARVGFSVFLPATRYLAGLQHVFCFGGSFGGWVGSVFDDFSSFFGGGVGFKSAVSIESMKCPLLFSELVIAMGNSSTFEKKCLFSFAGRFGPLLQGFLALWARRATNS